MSARYEIVLGGNIIKISNNYTKPTLIADELSPEQISNIENHYHEMVKNKKFFLHRRIFSIVFSGNKYLFALLASVLTGISVNILTGFLGFNEYDVERQMKVIVLLIFAVSFTIVLLLFASKIAQVQESGSTFIPRESLNLKYSEVLIAQRNLIYYKCFTHITYLVRLYCLSILFGICTVAILFKGNAIINAFRGVIICLTCLL